MGPTNVEQQTYENIVAYTDRGGHHHVAELDLRQGFAVTRQRTVQYSIMAFATRLDAKNVRP